MFFYAILSYLVCPIIGYYAGGKTLNAAGSGFIVGSLVSIILWFTIGEKMVNK